MCPISVPIPVAVTTISPRPGDLEFMLGHIDATAEWDVGARDESTPGDRSALAGEPASSISRVAATSSARRRGPCRRPRSRRCRPAQLLGGAPRRVAVTTHPAVMISILLSEATLAAALPSWCIPIRALSTVTRSGRWPWRRPGWQRCYHRRLRQDELHQVPVLAQERLPCRLGPARRACWGRSARRSATSASLRPTAGSTPRRWHTSSAGQAIPVDGRFVRGGGDGGGHEPCDQAGGPKSSPAAAVDQQAVDRRGVDGFQPQRPERLPDDPRVVGDGGDGDTTMPNQRAHSMPLTTAIRQRSAGSRAAARSTPTPPDHARTRSSARSPTHRRRTSTPRSRRGS